MRVCSTFSSASSGEISSYWGSSLSSSSSEPHQLKLKKLVNQSIIGYTHPGPSLVVDSLFESSGQLILFYTVVLSHGACASMRPESTKNYTKNFIDVQIVCYNPLIKVGI